MLTKIAKIEYRWVDMKKYYKTGEFAKMANLSIRTIRYYDKLGLLKPTMIAENGYSRVSNPAFKVSKDNGNYVFSV